MIQNSSKLPLTLSKKTRKVCFKFSFNCNHIVTIIRSLDSNKAYGHDMISICMLKLSSKPICKPLDLIYQSCIKHGMFLNK